MRQSYFRELSTSKDLELVSARRAAEVRALLGKPLQKWYFSSLEYINYIKGVLSKYLTQDLGIYDS